MIAVLSVGNSAIYGSSRTLAALAEQKQAPKCLAYIDRKGRPLVAILVTSAIGLIAYTAVMDSDASGQVFNWLLALSGLSSIFTWMTICLCHIRFRSAWKNAGHALSELPFRSQPGVLGSWAGFVFNALVFVAQFWVGIAPQGYASMSTKDLVVGFFEVYLAAPIIIISFVVYKVWYRTRWVRIGEVDLLTGLAYSKEELETLREGDRAERMEWSWWRRAYELSC